jgi:hypothetical protein
MTITTEIDSTKSDTKQEQNNPLGQSSKHASTVQILGPHSLLPERIGGWPFCWLAHHDDASIDMEWLLVGASMMVIAQQQMMTLRIRILACAQVKIIQQQPEWLLLLFQQQAIMWGTCPTRGEVESHHHSWKSGGVV